MNKINDFTNTNIPDTSNNSAIVRQITSSETDLDIVGNNISEREIIILNTETTSMEFTANEFIEKLKQHTLPDCGIIVNGDAKIEDCDIFCLPKKLIVTGKLSITRCHNITKITGVIQAKTILISDCNNFTEIAGNLESNRTLHISHCNNFIKLPDKLIISYLYLNNCSQIAQLPEDIKILTLLSINSCPKMTKLPKKLPILSMMSITSCHNIIIPEGLRVLGILTLENCNSIISLPEDMDIGSIIINDCRNFKSMPKKYSTMGNITIKNCKDFTSFPESWFNRGSNPFITIRHQIKCINTGINEQYVKYFYKQYCRQNITFTAESCTVSTSVKELISFWQNKAKDTENINLEELTTIETYTLLKFFNILTIIRFHSNECARKDLTHRAITILKSVSKNNWFKLEALKIMHNAVDDYGNNNSRDKRVLIALGNLEFLPRLYNLTANVPLL